MRLNIDVESVEHLSDAMDRSSKNVSWALIISALIVGSSIMVLANRSGGMDLRATLGLIGYMFAGILGVWRIIQQMRNK